MNLRQAMPISVSTMNKEEKKPAKTIRADLQMEGKICAQNNLAQLLVQLILGRAAWQRRAFIALLGKSRKMDTPPLW